MFSTHMQSMCVAATFQFGCNIVICGIGSVPYGKSCDTSFVISNRSDHISARAELARAS